MGLWFFLSVVVVGNWVFKAYKWRVISQAQGAPETNAKVIKLEREIAALKASQKDDDILKRLTQLEEAVYFGDFELKRKFQELEKEMTRPSQS